jgi:hypothetical protein
MNRKQNLKHTLSAAALSAIFVMAGAARADGGEYLLPVGYAATESNFEERGAEPVSCANLRQTSWFLHEMEKSDGQVEPTAPAVRCAVEIYAESTVDFD